MASIVSDDSSEPPNHQSLGDGKDEVIFRNDRFAIPGFRHAPRPRWAVGSFHATKSIKTTLRNAANKILGVVPAVPKGEPNFVVFLQSDDGEFEMTHSLEIAPDGEHYDSEDEDDLHPLFLLYRDCLIRKNFKGGDFGYDRRTRVVREQLEDGDGYHYSVEVDMDHDEGELVFLDTGYVYPQLQHDKLVSKGGREFSNSKLPLAFLKDYLPPAKQKVCHDQYLVQESGIRGNNARFLTRTDDDPNLKPGVFLDLNVEVTVPILLYVATRDIPAGTPLTIPATGTGFNPAVPCIPPNNAIGGRRQGGQRKNPHRSCRPSLSASRRSVDRPCKKSKDFHYGP